MIGFNSGVCMAFDVVLLVLLTDFSHFDSSDTLGLLGILTENVRLKNSSMMVSCTCESLSSARPLTK